jgi:hypothetical protein
MAHGRGRHLGLPVRWRLHAAPDGSFFEEVSSSPVTFCWGYAAPSDALWECDHQGAGAHLELDDREVVLLSLWVRTGYWLRPAAAAQLDIWLDDEAADDEDTLLGEGGEEEPGVAPDAGAAAAGTRVRLCLRLRAGGRMVARLAVNPVTGRAAVLRMRVAGDAEVWTFGAACGASGLPALVVHTAASGARDIYRTDGGRAPGPLPSSLFSPPPGSLDSLAGGSYDVSRPSRVPVERSRSGHTLVRVALNGVDAGLAILDTGASGFVISRAAADAAGLDAFGEVYVSGVGDKIAARFRSAATVRVGPLTVHSPLLLEMELKDLVWGASGPCIGIVGYDLFRRAVVDMPPPPACHVELHDPRAWAQSAGEREGATWRWLTVAMVANVPHAYARWHGAEGTPADAGPELLMLDSGAGGADAIFHARAVARLGLGGVGTFAGTSSIRGVSGSAPAPPRRTLAAAGASSGTTAVAAVAAAPTPTQRRQLEWLELLPSADAASRGPGSVRFRGVESLMLGTLGAFDLSEHMSGVVCMPLLARCRVVCDLLRRRVAFVSLPGDDEHASAAAPLD